MKFYGGACETCGRFVARAEDLVAYRRTGGWGSPIAPVDLVGEQPWSGVRVICRTCLDALVRFSREAAAGKEEA